jgi:hypothetical protein
MKKSLLLAALIVGVISAVMNPIAAIGNHEPADKASAAASDIDTVDSTAAEPILTQKMRVSSTSDLILQTTAECSILTSVFTDDETAQGSFGQVEMFITIDGHRVPVATDDAGDGEIVFCNRAYARQTLDTENDDDGVDSEDDFIRTRTANAFNWMAFDVGKNYDDDGDNVVEIVLNAKFTREPEDCGSKQADDALAPYGKTCADAFVGSRSLIAEAVHASNHEQADNGAE